MTKLTLPQNLPKDQNFLDLSLFLTLFLSLDKNSLDICLSFLLVSEFHKLKDINKILDDVLIKKENETNYQLDFGRYVSKCYQSPPQLSVDSKLSLKNILKIKYSHLKQFNGEWHNITLYQLARVNLDRPLYKYFSSVMDKVDVYEQLDELKKHGKNYSMSYYRYNTLKNIADLPHSTPIKYDEHTVLLNEKHYDWAFQLFKEAVLQYCTYVPHILGSPLEVICYPSDFRRIKLWEDVAITQLLLPLPFIQLYCSNRSFSSIPDEKELQEQEEDLRERSCSYKLMMASHPDPNRHLVPWPFQVDDHSGGGFAGVHKGNRTYAMGGPPLCSDDLRKDLAVLEKLFEVERQAFEEDCEMIDSYRRLGR